jgi:hypothetical protein
MSNFSSPFMKIATALCEKTNWPASESSIEQLSSHMELLDRAGLKRLNDRLVDGGARGFWDTLSEHKFAVELIRTHGTLDIVYEPPELTAPPDFRITVGGLNFWVQIKTLAAIERENRLEAVRKKFVEGIRSIAVGRFVSMNIGKSLKVADVPLLIKELARELQSDPSLKKFTYGSGRHPKARLSLWPPNKAQLDHLTLGIFGDLDIIDETGMSKNQTKASLKKAASRFTWNTSNLILNLIAMDADRHKDIDICEAIYGTEFERYSSARHVGWGRQADGVFHDSDFSKKVAGILVLRRSSGLPLAHYSRILYLNEEHRGLLAEIESFARPDLVVHQGMRPRNSNFNLSPH